MAILRGGPYLRKKNVINHQRLINYPHQTRNRPLASEALMPEALAPEFVHAHKRMCAGACTESGAPHPYKTGKRFWGYPFWAHLAAEKKGKGYQQDAWETLGKRYQRLCPSIDMWGAEFLISGLLHVQITDDSCDACIGDHDYHYYYA